MLTLRIHRLIWPLVQRVGLFLGLYAGGIAALLLLWPGVDFPETPLEVWLPALAGLGLVVSLWKPWALLRHNTQWDYRIWPLIFVWFLLISTSWNMYDYLHERLGGVREIHQVAELAQPGPARFFVLKTPFLVSKRFAGAKATSEVLGRQSTLYGNLYFACPLLATPADTLHPAPAWLEVSYSENLGDNLHLAVADSLYNEFIRRSEAEFMASPLPTFTYLVRAANSETRDALRAAVRTSSLAPPAATIPLIFLPVNEPLDARGSATLPWLLGFGAGGLGLVVLLLLKLPLQENEGSEQPKPYK